MYAIKKRGRTRSDTLNNNALKKEPVKIFEIVLDCCYSVRELSILPPLWYVNAIARYFQPVETPAPKSPSPSREVPTSTFVETPPNQQQQEEPPQKKQRPQQPSTEAVQSPEDNRVSSMSDDTSMAEQESPAVHEFADMLRFGILCRANSMIALFFYHSYIFNKLFAL